MPLQEELETSGNWLFRRRSYLPLALAALALLALWSRKDGGADLNPPPWQAFCLAVSMLGLALRCYTIGHAPARTSGRNQRAQVAQRLNTDGIYSLTRHPLYLGNFLMLLGLMLLPGQAWAVVVYALAFWIYYERIMYAEEAFLRRKFGPEFEDWAARTPAFWPRWKNWRPPQLPCSPRNVLRREYDGFFGLICCYWLLDSAAGWMEEGRWVWSPGWTFTVLGLGVLWLALRYVRKRTTWLRVEGR